MSCPVVSEWLQIQAEYDVILQKSSDMFLKDRPFSKMFIWYLLHRHAVHFWNYKNVTQVKSLK